MTELIQQITSRGTSHQTGEPTLRLNGGSVSYTTVSSVPVQFALENLSFQAEAGEQIAVVGPNGAGKSTLFKLIAGIIQPDEGNISLFGDAPERHICIAYVPQRSQIDWTFPVTVQDVVMMGRTKQIGFFRRPSRHDRQAVMASLERVNAAHLRNKQIGELSGGQQQRVFIARALAQEATLMLMDEPLTGLDVPSQETIFEILGSLRADEVTVLVATHDLQTAVNRFDKVMLLNRQLVAFDVGTAVLTPENLLAAYGGHVPR